MNWAEQIRNDNKAAFSDLFETYYTPLCEYAYSYVKQEEVMEDVVQEVFVRIWENRYRWEPRVAVRAYLYRSVYHQVINDYRKKRFETPLKEDSEANIPDRIPSPMEQLHGQDASNSIQQAISALPERRREILVLRLLHGLSYKEISATLGISVNTVDTQIRRALKTLRARLKHFVCHMEAMRAD
ncbi:RNA polymerase sigma-70 factor [Balneolales bacterium ANBcel1]|nr:RNA polymerase sigma-70 factor [Balneolales bacterium ANBcel1]